MYPFDGLLRVTRLLKRNHFLYTKLYYETFTYHAGVTSITVGFGTQWISIKARASGLQF